jgi:hypothetical protein
MSTRAELVAEIRERYQRSNRAGRTDRPAVADDRSAGMACAVARLALGAGKGLVALRFASSGHGSQFSHVT